VRDLKVSKVKNRILVVDDNEIIRNLLQELLSRKGYETMVAEDGSNALKVIQKSKPNLALVDLVLPDIPGIEVLNKIQQLSPITEAIVITGHSSFEAAKEVMDTNIVVGFLEKPIDINKLLETIENIIKRRKNQFKIQQTIDDLQHVNTQLDFFNSLIFQDVKLLNKALSKAIELIEKQNQNTQNMQCLRILKKAYSNNRRLIHSIEKMQNIPAVDFKKLQKIDLIKILKIVLEKMKNEYPDCIFPEIERTSQEPLYIEATKSSLKEFFTELFYSMVIPSIPVNAKIGLEINQSAALKNKQNKPIPTIDVKITVSAPRDIIKKEFEEESIEIINEFESQNYGVGFFLVKNYVDLFRGKIFLEDKKENGNLITTLIVHLPKIT
jgi:YesN/AraC family two-component response regulator